MALDLTAPGSIFVVPSPGPGQHGPVPVAYASWNGAIEVARWAVVAGPGDGDLEAVATAPRTGFETVVRGFHLGPRDRVVGVHAVDGRGPVLAGSTVVPA